MSKIVFKEFPISQISYSVINSTSICAGGNSSFFLSQDGSVWGWGLNSEGEIGDKTTINKSSPILVVGNHSFIKIFTKYKHSLAKKQDGSIWSWGWNSFGGLGDGTNSSRSSPVLVIGNHSFVDISAGYDHSLARKQDGSAWSWGANTYGQLGSGTFVWPGSKSSPTLVVGNHSFIKISAGDLNSLALKQNGELWSWGSSKSSPVLISSDSFIQISAGGKYQSLALKQDGSAWAWGSNGYGEFGNNKKGQFSDSPVICAYIPIKDIHNFTNTISVITNTTYSIQFNYVSGSPPFIQFGDYILGVGDTLVISWIE